MFVVKKLSSKFVLFFSLTIIVVAALLISANHQKKPTTAQYISAQFEDKTAHAQVEVDKAFFEEIVNRSLDARTPPSFGH